VIFSDFNFSTEVLEGLSAMNFENATPIQEMAIPIITSGKDLIACAQTGTGKTAAYLLPILDKLVRKGSNNGTSTIILVPTRELALQIDQQMEGFSYYLPVTSTAIYGGNDKAEWERQKTSLVQGADIVVATPGRMLQHLSMGYVIFDQVEHLILDEADRMLDMGFFEDIMQVVMQLPKQRQNLMFSATMPPKIREFAQQILKSPEEISLAISKPAEGILQAAYLVYDHQKIELINRLLKGKNLSSIIIFSSTKQKVKEIAKSLASNGFNSQAIHSDLEQNEREQVLLDFRNRKIQILVATDIIARGIDIKDIELVINFDVPHDAEDYVHRIGRTARAKTQGVGITFINDKEQRNFRDIERLIETTIYKSPLPPEMEPGPEYNPDRPSGSGSRHGGGGKGKFNKNRNKNNDRRPKQSSNQ
jgi:superfamily II DNA/RNA helicase